MSNENLFDSFLRGRDRAILDILTTKVSFMSLRQIADAFYASDMANAVRRLETLEERSLLVSYRLNSRTPPEILEPLVVWNPGEDQPSPPRLAFVLAKRWLRQGTQMRLCFFAGKKYEALTGFTCHAKPTRIMQASHDLGLAGLYLRFRSERKADADRWIGEHSFRSAGATTLAGERMSEIFSAKKQKPDAILVDETGIPLKAIEYGGIYNVKRLDRFHRWCQQRSLPYEIW